MGEDFPNDLTSSLSADGITASWVKTLNAALKINDVNAVVDCIHPDGWFRDLMTFTWKFRTRHGHVDIRSYLKSTLVQAQVSAVEIDTHPDGKPRISELPPGTPIIESALRFETPKAHCRGYVRIYPPKNGEIPKAFMLMMMLSDWKGHEEPDHEVSIIGNHKSSWEEVRAQHRAEVERDPYVLIVGAGHAGLQVAARFSQMNIKALVIERTTRVGDVWRERYPTLSLHTPRSHHQLLYAPYPSTWPKWSPKDKLADWMEQYATTQELVLWTSTTLEPTPVYDETTRRWNVSVSKNGVPVRLNPAHIIMAVSIFGDPVLPSVPGATSFQGTIFHSGAYKGGAPFAGKRVVVVGAANTAADICQDLSNRGAASVTMVQRSATAVISSRLNEIQLDAVFPEGRAAYYSDLALQGLPMGAFREISKKLQPFREEFDKEMHEGLKGAGLKLTAGPDGSGQIIMVYERLGGYIIDVGVAELIISGKVKVKQGAEIERMTPTSVIFNDGSELDADAVIYATGWKPLRTKLRTIFGDEVTNRLADLWGIDEEGEPGGGFKPSGQPGLWFAAAEFSFGRFLSKQLALFIKATEIGYYSG